MGHIFDMRLATALVSVTLLGQSAVFAQSEDSVFAAKGFQQNRDYFSQEPTEAVDTLTGNVILTYTLLALPGNAGHELRVQRTWNSKNGIWRLGVIGVPELGDSFNPDVPPLFTDASGAEHRTVPVASDVSLTPRDWLFATADFWKYNRTLRQLYLPDGTVVTYDPAHRPVSVDNRYGQLLSVAYGPTSTCPAARCIRQYLSGANVREVRLDTTSVTLFPDAADPGDARVWDISAGDVTPPVGPGWHFDYVGFPGSTPYALTVTNPHGGVTEYTFETHPWWYLTYPCPTCQGTIQTEYMSVLHQRTVLAGGQPPATWTYEYEWGNGESTTQSHVTTMADPDGVTTTYRYLGDVQPGGAVIG